MKRYVIKTNGAIAFPNGVCRPQNLEQWVGGELCIHTRAPALAREGKIQNAPPISEGDELWLWAHEAKEYGDGRGITAKATAGPQRVEGDRLYITLRNTELFPRPFGYKDLGQEPSGSRLFDFLKTYRKHTTYLVEGDDYPDFISLVETHTSSPSDEGRSSGMSERTRENRERKGETLEALRGRLKNRFLLKVNGVLHCPGEICRPANAEEWEGGDVLTPLAGPLRAEPGLSQEAPQIQSGDELWIWTHEDDQFGRGWGLTARAIAGEQKDTGEHLAVPLTNVELLPRKFGFRDLGEGETGSRLLDYARSRRHYQVYLIEDADYDDFIRVVEERSARIPEEEQQKYTNGRNAAIRRHAEDLLAVSEERRLGLRKLRPHQQRFREAQMERHRGRCVISRSTAPEALEAAHVVPHNGDPVFEAPDNGLLLRSDLHKLFDAYLWSIHPGSGKVRISDDLKDTGYAKLSGKEVDHKLAPEFLGFHFRQFEKVEKDRQG
ncbi:HNH endonuclease signature motif containing protein [Leisingera sp. JC11]|uniref:HNH endonuclease n=1 Tax=Leisingera sp. JC11 TaxID=3042469 RepID=UPI0034555C4B